MDSELFSQISTFIFDIDGVLTDGTILVLENGVQARRMHIKDGYALQLAVKKNYRVVIISGAAPSPVVDRLEKLGITEIHMSVKDKKQFIAQLAATDQLSLAGILYMGDDMPDIAAMSIVGLPTCPSDAVTEIKGAVKYISPVPGGLGCVRDVIEKVLKLRGDWNHAEGVTSR